MEAPSSDRPLQRLLVVMAGAAREFGTSLEAIASSEATPLQLAAWTRKKGDFAHGVVCALAQVLHELRKSPQGRQALLDFGLDEFFGGRPGAER